MLNNLPDKTKKIKASFTKILFPELRALGFSGGWSGFCRQTSLGVDVLVFPFDYGCIKLDCGRLPRRKILESKTIRQDWADYARAPYPVRGCARTWLVSKAKGRPKGYTCFEYGDITKADQYENMALAAVRAVKKEGLKFWSIPRRVKK